jgi:hypothetical protein
LFIGVLELRFLSHIRFFVMFHFAFPKFLPEIRRRLSRAGDQPQILKLVPENLLQSLEKFQALPLPGVNDVEPMAL